MALKKWIWKETAEVLGVLGIIAGIVFLGFELNQNNELLQNEARYNLLTHRSGEIDELVQNPDLADLWWKGRDGIEMTQSENARYGLMLLSRLIRWNWYFEQYESGLVDEESLPLVAWREILNRPDHERRWNGLAPLLTPEFVAFIEANVIAE